MRCLTLPLQPPGNRTGGQPSARIGKQRVSGAQGPDEARGAGHGHSGRTDYQPQRIPNPNHSTRTAVVTTHVARTITSSATRCASTTPSTMRA